MDEDILRAIVTTTAAVATASVSILNKKKRETVRRSNVENNHSTWLLHLFHQDLQEYIRDWCNLCHAEHQ